MHKSLFFFGEYYHQFWYAFVVAKLWVKTKVCTSQVLRILTFLLSQERQARLLNRNQARTEELWWNSCFCALEEIISIVFSIKRAIYMSTTVAAAAAASWSWHSQKLNKLKALSTASAGCWTWKLQNGASVNIHCSH